MGFSPTASQFQRAVSRRMPLSAREINVVMAVTEIDRIMVTNDAVKRAQWVFPHERTKEGVPDTVAENF